MMRGESYHAVLAELRSGGDAELTRWRLAEGIYWWLADHHSGQWSEEYRMLCNIPFKPAPSANGPTDPDSGSVYAALCDDNRCDHD
jgi:hypothetical protein